MDYKLKLKDGTEHIVEIIATTFKKLKVWKVQFKDGKEVMLYKVGNEWMQRIDDFLDQITMATLGAHIDEVAAG
jgi:predicted DNA-binding antitoxin AbrB/MazE fold protein